MKLSKKEEVLLQNVVEAMQSVNDGHPMKDFLDDEEIVDALNLLVKVTSQ